MAVPAGCGAGLFELSDTDEILVAGTPGAPGVVGVPPPLVDGASTGYEMIADASGCATLLAALRTQALTLYCWLATVGVHKNCVAAALQFPALVQFTPSGLTNHRYSSGAVPPWEVARKVMVVPGGCGADKLATIVTAVTGVGAVGVEGVGKGTVSGGNVAAPGAFT